MRRTNRRHTRAVERHRRNKGPEMLSQAADEELQKRAGHLARRLSEEVINHGDVAAATLLVDLAETVRYNDESPTVDRAFSIIDRWETEPQVIGLDTSPQCDAGQNRLQITDGAVTEQSDEILDAEFEDVDATESSAEPLNT